MDSIEERSYDCNQLTSSPIIIRGDSDSDWRGCGSWTGPFAAISSKSEHHEGRHLLSRWMNVDSPTPSSRVGGRLTVVVSHSRRDQSTIEL